MTLSDLSRIISGLPEPVLLIEAEGTICAANPGASSLFQRASLNLVGKPLSTLVTDDGEKLSRYLRQCSRSSEGILCGLNIVPSTERPVACKVMGRLEHSEDQLCLVRLQLFPRESANVRMPAYNEQLQALAQEGLVRRQNEQLWRAAFENSAIGMMLADLEGRLSAANTVFQSMLGYTESELCQLTFLDVTHEEDRQANIKLIGELVEGKRQHFQIEQRYCRKDGTSLWVTANISLVPGIGDAAPFLFGVVEDITGSKRVEEALQITQAELCHVSRLTTMGELAASIAHEVNQPLTAITNNSNGCLRLLANGNLEAGVLHRALDEIVADSSRASAIIARIRAFINKAPPEKNKLDINDIVQEVLALTGRELSENRVLLERELTEGLPHVLGDRVQLQQVLLNLIMNGIESMTVVTNRPRLLRVQSRIDESGSVEIAVRDSGAGLGLDADRVFTPFFTTKANGMGMGLPISRSLIEAHGGLLWATANSPHGAVFYFTVPAGSRS